MSEISNKAVNALHSAAHEFNRQLMDNSDPTLDLIDTQLRVRNIPLKLIRLAKSAPDGKIVIMFCNKMFPKKPSLSAVLNSSDFEIAFWNCSDRDKHLYRTVIAVDSRWSNELLTFQTSLDLGDHMLKRI